MTATVQSQIAGAKIVEWYSSIIAKQLDQATALKEEAKDLVTQMEKNDKILAFYSLVSFRHDILATQFKKVEENSAKLAEIGELAESSLDRTLNYFYYFVSAQNEYIHERYRSAIKLLRKAEKFLACLHDDAEEAEFSMYAGVLFYRLNQYPVAASYMEEAYRIFKRLNYEESYLNAQIVLAGIDSELGHSQKAQVRLKEALSESDKYPVVRGLIYRAIALDHIRNERYYEAEDKLQLALSIKEHANHQVGAKSQYNLSNVMFRQGKTEQALTLFKIAELGASYYKNKEYSSRCLFTRGLYIEGKMDLVNQAIEKLEANGMFFEVAEVAEEAANYTEKRGDLKSALNFWKVAYAARLNQNIGGCQE
ncbi:Rap family tetratricopeptide repeat protein [Shouchella tritolerans]|uniref:Rap family tetratricopeptide repeat protein n=1 Tax=Shouchella tritolerans TaxID=2979466 RepID=UPI0021E859D1|nr:Rap family tetratricopeptide repeat protein [Shouchella tritolerans]